MSERLTTVQLTSSEDNHPDASLGITLSNEIGDVEGDRTIKEDCEQFQRDNGQIDATPTLIGTRIDHPKLSKGVVAAALGSVDALVTPTQEVVRRRPEVFALCRVDVAEEAVVQEASFNDEMAQRIGQMPNEQEPQRRGSRLGQHGA